MREYQPAQYGVNTRIKQLRELVAAFDDKPEDTPVLVMLREIPGTELAGDSDYRMYLWSGGKYTAPVWLEDSD